MIGCVYICRNCPWIRINRGARKASPDFVFGMLSAGLSMGLMSALYNIGSVILQSSINALGEVYIAAQVGSRRLAELFYMPGVALGTGAATFTSQNYGAGRRRRIGQGVRAALLLYGIWWLFALGFTFTRAEDAVRLITGSRNTEVISGAVLYLKINIPLIPPMAVLVILRNTMQGMRHLVMPLVCSSLELIGKVIFASVFVPVWGYRAVCVCEPVLWIICFLFITAGAIGCRREFRDE